MTEFTNDAYFNEDQDFNIVSSLIPNVLLVTQAKMKMSKVTV
jgi:hypothetical protein